MSLAPPKLEPRHMQIGAAATHVLLDANTSLVVDQDLRTTNLAGARQPGDALWRPPRDPDAARDDRQADRRTARPDRVGLTAHGGHPARDARARLRAAGQSDPDGAAALSARHPGRSGRADHQHLRPGAVAGPGDGPRQRGGGQPQGLPQGQGACDRREPEAAGHRHAARPGTRRRGQPQDGARDRRAHVPGQLRALAHAAAGRGARPARLAGRGEARARTDGGRVAEWPATTRAVRAVVRRRSPQRPRRPGCGGARRAARARPCARWSMRVATGRGRHACCHG